MLSTYLRWRSLDFLFLITSMFLWQKSKFLYKTNEIKLVIISYPTTSHQGLPVTEDILIRTFYVYLNWINHLRDLLHLPQSKTKTSWGVKHSYCSKIATHDTKKVLTRIFFRTSGNKNAAELKFYQSNRFLPTNDPQY